MTNRTVYRTAGAMLVGSVAGCGSVITAPVATPPVAISAPTVSAEQNPDVIWIVRNTEVVIVGDDGKPALGMSDSKRTLSALFACYRRPTTSPGAPECYISKYTWNATDLEWPGPVLMSKDGNLRIVGSPPATPTR